MNDLLLNLKKGQDRVSKNTIGKKGMKKFQ